MRKKVWVGIVCVLGLISLSLVGVVSIQGNHQTTSQQTRSTISKSTSTTTTASTSSSASTVASSEVITEPTASTQSTAVEETSYPDLSQYSQLAVHVSIAEQTMTITSGDEIIFTTTVSTGAADSPTPTGSFVIETERGNFFYNAESGEGAYYWVSFKDHGIYLFHSIPTDEQGNEIPEEAAKLGTPSSHGCVRMPRETAKWFYEQIPEGTPVTVA